MKAPLVSIFLILALVLLAPSSAGASWWGWGGDHGGRALDPDGYDANTVTTVRGRITAIRTDDDPQARLDMETSGGSVTVLLGPADYWAEHGIELTVGDQVTVRGSKAQGENGVVYLLAQTIGSESRDLEVSLRNDTGQPAWSGGGNRPGYGGGAGGQRRQHNPARLGGGRMGR